MHKVIRHNTTLHTFIKTLGAISLLAVACWWLGCATPGTIGVNTPGKSLSGYPPTGERAATRQQFTARAWQTLLADNRLDALPYDGHAVLGTPRALSAMLVGRINVLTRAPGDQFKDREERVLALKDGLRRFIEKHRQLLTASAEAQAITLSDLSLISFAPIAANGSLSKSNDDAARYEAFYQQRSYDYPLAAGYGELRLLVSQEGKLLQWSSTLLPKIALPARPLIDLTALPDRFVGQEFTATTAPATNTANPAGAGNAGNAALRYRVANAKDVFVRAPLIYPRLAGDRLALHLAIPVEVGSGITWTIYVDALTGDELAVQLNST